MAANVIKFQAPFEKLKFSKTSPDVMLRKAIILQAIIDCSNISENKILKKQEIEAKSWIFGKSEYFIQICEEAGLEPDFVIRIARNVMLIHKNKIPNKVEEAFNYHYIFEKKYCS